MDRQEDMRSKQEDIHAEVQENIDRGWGDLWSWLWVALLVFGVLGTGWLIYVVVGQGTAQTWNLGEPPTAPNFIAPLIRLF